MITVKTEKSEFVLKPTIFPDKTSQVWKLPEEILTSKEFLITWNFEEEREIMDLYSLHSLLPDFRRVWLHLPYLPYGRQDKLVGNDRTFNLTVFADLINALKLDRVTTVDAHNPARFERLFNQSENMAPYRSQLKAVEEFQPTFFVFPDKGAMERYEASFLTHPDTRIYFDKVRDQSTGQITGLTMNAKRLFYERDRLLIIDDICDGGATFIGVAKELRKIIPNQYLKIGLFVTHGIFSRGRQHLLDNGIDEIYTTNSLLSNKEGYKV